MILKGLIIIVTGNTKEIMENYREASETKKYVWYCYFGDPVTKPYGKGYKNAFFIGNGKLYHTCFSEIRAGPKHNGKRLPECESEFLPEEYKDNIKLQDEIAFFLKCGVIRELDYNKAIGQIYYEKTGEEYIPSEVRNAVCYITFKNSLNNVFLGSKLPRNGLKTKRKMKVFLDANVLISYFKNEEILRNLFSKEVLEKVQYITNPVVCQEIILAGDRIKEKIDIKKLDNVNIVQTDTTKMDIGKIKEFRNKLVHTNDILILQSATSGSDYLLTFDKNLLNIKGIESLKIISPDEFFELLGAGQ